MACEKFLLKICLIGSMGTEKTTIIRKFALNKFETNYLPTLGVDITTKEIEIDDTKVKLILVDTAGQEFFGKLRPSYYRGASACVIFTKMYDDLLLEEVPDWLAEFRKHMPDQTIPITLIGVFKKDNNGNKINSKRIRINNRKHRHYKNKFRVFSWPREIIEYILKKLDKGKEKEKRSSSCYIGSSFTESDNNHFYWKKGKKLAKKLGLTYREVEVSDVKAFDECIRALTRQVLCKSS